MPTADEALATFTAIVRRLAATPEMAVPVETALADLEGLDSLRLLEAMALSEARLGVEIDTNAMDSFTTVGDVIAALLAARPA